MQLALLVVAAAAFAPTPNQRIDTRRHFNFGNFGGNKKVDEDDSVKEAETVDDVGALPTEIAGLTPGFHGLHITVRGNTSKGTASCGTIFDPFRAKHGNPSNGKDKRKVGGLGNVEANAEGVAKVAIEDALLDLILSLIHI